jgi:hypothetical protein
MKQVALFAPLEAFGLLGQSTPRDEAMEMKMKVQALVPGMQDGDEAQLAPEALLAVTAEGQEGLGHRPEKDIDHGLFVV